MCYYPIFLIHHKYGSWIISGAQINMDRWLLDTVAVGRKRSCRFYSFNIILNHQLQRSLVGFLVRGEVSRKRDNV